MSLASRKKTVLAKIETTYGTDSSPTGSANAILVKNLDVQPISAETVSRDLVRPFFGNSEQLLAQKFSTMSFEVEYAGAGVVGAIPGFGPLLRACALAQTVLSSAVTAVVAGGVATVTKAAHGYVVGDKVTTSGFTAGDLNGAKTIVSVPSSSTFTFATIAADAGSAGGSLSTGIQYAPISNAFESVTMYYNVDGVLHKLTGCFGTVELSLAVKTIPTFKFNFTGIYNAPTDTAAPTVDYTGYQIPFLANTQNTPGFTLYGFTAPMQSMSLNIANDIQYVTRVGYESIKVLDRKPAGTIVFDAPKMADKDFFSLVASNTAGSMALTHGPKNGHKIVLTAPSVLLGNPSYSSSDGVEMLSCPFTANPVAGNDEFSFVVQ